jgi:hypothetical protein
MSLRQLLCITLMTLGCVHLDADQMSSSAMPNLADCSNLTHEEQSFASQLSDSLKKLFCEYFNTDQRAAAMQLRNASDGTPIQPDDAVLQVAREQGIAPQPIPQSGGASGCPRK